MWAEALELLRGAQQLQRRFFQLGAAEAPGWEPPVDLYETSDGLTLCVALPGVAAANLEVSIESGTVLIRGERAFPWSTMRRLDSGVGIPRRSRRRIELHGKRAFAPNEHGPRFDGNLEIWPPPLRGARRTA